MYFTLLAFKGPLYNHFLHILTVAACDSGCNNNTILYNAMSSVLEHVHSRRNLNKNRVENLKTCEQGIFCRVRTCENPANWYFAWQLHVHVGLKPDQVTTEK